MYSKTGQNNNKRMTCLWSNMKHKHVWHGLSCFGNSCILCKGKARFMCYPVTEFQPPDYFIGNS